MQVDVPFAAVCAGCCVAAAAMLSVARALLQLLSTSRDFRKKYGAEWGVVAGASGAVGGAVCSILAEQGVGVVMAGLGPTLPAAAARLRRAHPAAEIALCPADLSTPEGVAAVDEAARMRRASLLFCCAGEARGGLFCDENAEAARARHRLATEAPLMLVHGFARRLIDSKRRGFVGLLSCASAKVPSPLMSAYSAQQAFSEQLGVSLAAELRPHGVDVVVVRCSPIRSQLLRGVGLRSVDWLETLSAGSPAGAARCFFKPAAFSTVRNCGPVAALAAAASRLFGTGVLGDACGVLHGFTEDSRCIARTREEIQRRP
eukprot:TRINITY_DN32868_c0_g1_i1.p1 TRINITY_DN32868_c0_g1~~TRINITY_DN32868_c0_g1_i1.p1  ORF type:complete len:339 (+),score=114.71 TRINITY_DN32868_c0_g1_i1:67-1017(+)